MARASTGGARIRGPIVRMLLGGAGSAGVATVAAALCMAAIGGSAPALSALGAGAVVTTAFFVGIAALAFVVAGPGSVASMSVMAALVVYLGQLIALTAVALALRDAPWLDRTGVVVGGVVAVLAWQAGQIRGFATSRTPVFAEAVR